MDDAWATPARSLEGRGALVVGGGQAAGATTGNGRATAQELAARGARVVVADCHESSAKQTVDLITGRGGDAVAIVGDVAAAGGCEALEEEARSLLGAIDILHNNVGVMVSGRIDDLSREEWQRALDVNLTGTWAMCKAVLPGMRDRRRGSIVNISSLASLGTSASTIAYGVSKSAVNALTRTLALENAPYGVRVNAILPGLIDTPMGVDAPATAEGVARMVVADRRAAMCPMGAQGTAWDVAHAAAFLVSDEAAFITGVLLPVDGGSSLQTSTGNAPWLREQAAADPAT